ncbi:hypothetical protein SLA2020_160180 [Shorea laevis]
METVTTLVAEKPLVIFSKNKCDMCHTIKTLFYGFGVNPTIYELDEMPRGHEIEQALSTVPTVFVGGELVGGPNEVMSHHLNRSLIPMLRRAGAIWV